MKKYIGFAAAAFLGALLALGAGSFFKSDSKPSIYEEVYAKYANLKETPGGMPSFTVGASIATPCVVHVKSTMEMVQGQGEVFDPFGFFEDHGFQMPPQEGSGSGVIVSPDGYIVTNNHVIDGATKLEVILADKRSYQAEVIGRDPNTDIALIKIDAKELPFMLYGNSDEVKVGEWVLAVGNPFNLTSTVTAGIVSAKGRNINLLRDIDPQARVNNSIEAFIQTDAAVNPGNSGGALVTPGGKLIGINTAIASQTGSYAGYSFAIPSNLVKKVVDDLKEFGEVQRGYIGVQIQDVNADIAREKGLDRPGGVLVAEVNEGSAGDKAGIKKGDVITKINGVPVNSPSELQEQVSRFRPGDKLSVVLIRDKSEKTAEVVLKGKEGSGITAKKQGMAALGADLETISPAERSKLKIGNGVRIKKLSNGPLKEAGIPEGFIITSVDKHPVSTPEEVKRIISMKKGGILIEGLKADGTKGYYGVGLDN